MGHGSDSNFEKKKKKKKKKKKSNKKSNQNNQEALNPQNMNEVQLIITVTPLCLFSGGGAAARGRNTLWAALLQKRGRTWVNQNTKLKLILPHIKPL